MAETGAPEEKGITFAESTLGFFAVVCMIGAGLLLLSASDGLSLLLIAQAAGSLVAAAFLFGFRHVIGYLRRQENRDVQRDWERRHEPRE